VHSFHHVTVAVMPRSLGHWLRQGGLRRGRGPLRGDCISLALEQDRGPECYETQISQNLNLGARKPNLMLQEHCP